MYLTIALAVVVTLELMLITRGVPLGISLLMSVGTGVAVLVVCYARRPSP